MRYNLNMSELRKIIGTNLQELRKQKKYTQLDLANELGYSDKAISKWEKGDSLPDIEVLYQIANFYGVTLDFLTHEGSLEDKKDYIIPKDDIRNKIIICILTILIVWSIGLIVYFYKYFQDNENIWTSFIWPIPATFLVLYIFNAIWGKKIRRYFIASMFAWGIILSLYLEALRNNENVWMIFILGVPIQLILILWSQLKHNAKI